MIFAYIPPPPAKNFAAAQLMDGGGVLEAMHDVYRRLTFPWHRPRPATQAACPWRVFLDSAAAYRSKTSAGLQPSRCNELDARAISAARVLMNIKEVTRKDDDTWNGGGEAQNVTDVKTTDRVCEERCIRVKTIEKMPILLPQSSKFRLRRARRGLPGAAALIHYFDAPSGKSSQQCTLPRDCEIQTSRL